MQETAVKANLKIGRAGVATLILASIILGHFAKWVGDGLYYTITQTTATMRDWWNRLPVHLDNLLGHQGWLAPFVHGQQASPLWVFCRHGARDLGIGLFASLLVKMALQKPLKKRCHYRAVRLALTPVFAWLVALPVWVLGLWFFWTYQSHGFGWDYTGTNPWLLDISQLVGKTSIEYTLIGVLSGLLVMVTKVIKNPADEFQWLLAEQPWSRLILFPGMHARRKAIASGETALAPPNKMVARLVSLAVLASFGFAVYGFWLTEFGPARGAS